MNLEMLMGRGVASPNLKQLSGLANLFAHVHHGPCLPRDMTLWIRWTISMGFRLRRVLPDGPASVLQSVVTP